MSTAPEDSITPLFKGRRVDRGEVVVGLVGAMGTDLDQICTELGAAFVSVAYRVEHVRVSSLIDDFMASEKIDIPVTEKRTKIDRLMDQGDALRDGLNHGAAAAVLAVGRIAHSRAVAAAADGTDPDEERQNVATVIRQLKHPQEVDALRSIYGPRFALLGVWSTEEQREAAVERRLQSQHPGMTEEWYAHHIRRLMVRDEKDASRQFGQRVRETYELADAFVTVTPGHDSASEVARFVRLLFGSYFETPTADEHAMFVAAGASLRSSDAGRQVGAVVVDTEGEVVVSGVNEIPKPHGGQYWVGDVPDLRDFKIGYDENARQKVAIVADILSSLSDSGWLDPKFKETKPEKLARDAMSNGGPLEKSRIADLLEFARVAHAEMAAICTAARRGVSLAERTMYTTTYPCHECARLIIASGISRVIYVDPYPKSQVSKMFSNEVSETASKNMVSFEPYSGVAPRFYRSVFRMTGRSRDNLTGTYGTWKPDEALPRVVTDAQLLNNLVTAEGQFYEAAFELLVNTDWAPAIERSFDETSEI
ncbi:anti-phage dCTP deaminase [Nocardioides sp. L-11A]|uniref:anti-phage dCTP deaminase n=1 Tax=Nocardioides sp. L-11A TaxID=3043848 RepID=UPI00249CC07C|nr:anti-phage dCTP deaminase [Nocardioides sp. L-11A]